MVTPAPACPREKRSDTPAVPREYRDVTPLPAAPREYRDVTYGTVEGVRVLGGLVRVTAGAEVLDRPGTPGDRLVPVYSGLLASGVVTVGAVSRTGRVVSIRELGGRAGVGEERMGVHVLARGVSPTRFSPVCVGGATGTVVRVLGVETLARLDGTEELKMPVRLEVLAPRMPGYVVARLDGTTVLVTLERLDGVVVTAVLRARGDMTAG